jgi:hypothetical protein
MKKLLLPVILALIAIPSLMALPLTALVFQKSKELTDKVAAWNKQCGDKPDDEKCTKKRHELSRELGEFAALVNDELNVLRGPVSENAPDSFLKEFNGRRKVMELEMRVALYNLKCLGAPAADPQCSAESAAIDAEKTALQAEYKQTHAAFDGKWISIPVTISPAPKKR